MAIGDSTEEPRPDRFLTGTVSPASHYLQASSGTRYDTHEVNDGHPQPLNRRSRRRARLEFGHPLTTTYLHVSDLTKAVDVELTGKKQPQEASGCTR